MLTQSRRPATFGDVHGQRVPVEVMRRAVADPKNAARVYLFHGFYGVGKTTLARVFARALNCCSSLSLEPCGKCAQCSESLDYAPYYAEYDCGAVGSVDDVRAIRDSLVLDSSLAKYRVAVFDEFHLASKQAQSALLKVLEEMRDNTFVIMCTTEQEKILSTVRSRSVELFFNRLPDSEMEAMLEGLAKAEGKELTKAQAAGVVSAAAGHARDAVKLLDLVFRVGYDVALETHVSVSSAAEALLAALASRDEAAFSSALDRFVSHTRSRYTRALYSSVYEMLRPGSKSPLAAAWGSEAFRLFRTLMQPWAVEAMRSGDVTAKALMWSLWQGMAKQEAAASASRDRFSVRE